ncbi:MAG: nucleotidyltransferase [Bacteroidales bacterium]|jgi:choline kinase|nr:sugar phosphate nucleotidyltransferase [Bacteroidales bacterium]MCK9499884.1 sugar phosphate nucleotidyltransferase [Bacteroidales bacterium]MDY0313810.1 sugar phosphate nucleotidyltransferase [Bacteroidales bacterium]NLB85545.1 nucleotidyltransferase [Bacteroidales bacterium]
MKPTLFILAAGMGSRYGGLKQLDGLGPNGETIMDYSVYDAIKAGFGKLVFVIRKSFEEEFREKIVKKYENKIPVKIVFQELDYLPEGFSLNPARIKPWGTNHAVMMGKNVISEPFAVINADDFYGRDGFKVLAEYLSNLKNSKNKYCMVGYRLGNTLSESGTVARGVCESDENNLLTTVVERTKVKRNDGKVQYLDENEKWITIPDNSPVSMNMWGFTPDYFKYSDELFVDFLKENSENNTTEFYIPMVVNHLIVNKISSVEVLDTDAKWFGVTYAEDRNGVVEKLAKLVKEGEYPSPLWEIQI